MSTLLAGLSGAAVVGGLLMLVAGLYGTTAPVVSRPPASRRVRALLRPRAGRRSRRRRVELAVAAAVGLGLLAVTGLPVPAAVAAATVAGVPPLLRSVAGASADIARLEALQTWVRRLSDLLGTNSELTKMLTESARTAPPPIAAELSDLAVRLDSGWPVDTALRALADDLGTATGDLVVAALILGMRDRGGGLAEVLARLADTIAEDVRTRRTIEADRAKPRTTARLVILITLGVAAAMALFNPAFLAPYATPVGQVALAVIAAYMAGCLVWLQRLAASPREPRFLTAGPGR